MYITLVSKKGGRKHNEDAAGKLKKNGITCVVTADGLGGYSGGAAASSIAVESVLKRFAEKPEFSVDAVRRYILTANEAIVAGAEMNPLHQYMSSTIVVLLIKGKRAVWGNIGDTRLYRFSKSRLEEVTEDHSLAFMDFLCGDIEYGDIRTSPNQNKLTSALGAAGGEMNISKITELDSAAGFLLCTDGWWEYVTEEDMEETLSKSKSSNEWVEKMLEIREHNAPEGSDNYTAAAIIL